MGIMGGGAVLRLDGAVWKDALERIRRAGVGRRLRWEAPEGGSTTITSSAVSNN